jgi:hypothetical protein
MNHIPTRRDLLKSAVAVGAIQLIESSNTTLTTEPKPHVIGDRLWLWSHFEGSHNGGWGLPATSRITPVEAAAYMSIPNVIMVGYDGKPAVPFDQYAMPFQALRTVVWSVVGAGGATQNEERDAALELAKGKNNFTGVIMDDFFTGKKDEDVASLSITQLRELQGQLKKPGKKLDLWVTLYTWQLHLPIQEHMKYVDVATLWAWTAPEIDQFPENLAKAEELFPKTRKVLGCYMWDYGRSRPMPVASMEKQCDFGLESLKAGRIEGIIFLASCICDLNLETVEWTREWIREHRSVELSQQEIKR